MICIIGLGYVGLPLANAFAKKYNVFGIDISENRIKDLNRFNDQTLELSSDELKRTIGSSLQIFADINKAKDCKIYIVTVPTPVKDSKQPDLSPVINATKSVATIL